MGTPGTTLAPAGLEPGLAFSRISLPNNGTQTRASGRLIPTMIHCSTVVAPLSGRKNTSSVVAVRFIRLNGSMTFQQKPIIWSMRSRG